MYFVFKKSEATSTGQHIYCIGYTLGWSRTINSSSSQGSDGQRNPAHALRGSAASPTCNQVRKNLSTITCIVCDKAVHVLCFDDSIVQMNLCCVK